MTDAALKYHLYKSPKRPSTKSDALALCSHATLSAARLEEGMTGTRITEQETIRELKSPELLCNRLFLGCTFEGLTLSDVELRDTILRDCLFVDCNIDRASYLNVRIESVDFESCSMRDSNFTQVKSAKAKLTFNRCDLKGSRFDGLSLIDFAMTRSKAQQVSFVETNLAHGVFSDSDLLGAVFDRCCLQDGNLAGAHHLSLDLRNNTFKRTRLSLPTILSSIDELGIEVGP